jgi:hypothetical protein
MPENDNTQQTTDTTTTPPVVRTPATPPDTQQDNKADTGAGDEKPIMNTAQLLERLERDRKALLSKLGYDDEKAAKAALDEAKKLKDAQLSETERATKALADANKERDEAKARITELEHAAKVKDFKDTLLTTLTNAKAEYPAQLAVIIQTDAEFAKWLEDDKPNEKAIQKWVEDYKSKFPKFFTSGNGNPGSPSNRGATGNPTTDLRKLIGNKPIVKA